MWSLQHILHKIVLTNSAHALYYEGVIIRTHTSQNRSLWDKTWRDRRGRVIVWQTPNAPLMAWLVLTIFSLLVNGRLANILYWVGSAALITWSLLEIFKGVNYVRRALGLLVLVLAVASLVKGL